MTKVYRATNYGGQGLQPCGFVFFGDVADYRVFIYKNAGMSRRLRYEYTSATAYCQMHGCRLATEDPQ